MQNLETVKTVKQDLESWDWETSEKLIADLLEVRGHFAEVHELAVTPDGEKIAAPVRTQDGEFTACVNGEPWPQMFEFLWYLKFSPDGRLTALAKSDDQWTVTVDGECWEEKFEYIWNTRFSADGSVIAAQAKREMDYMIVVNGKPWSNIFLSTRGLNVSDDGEKVVAVVQAVPLKEADIFGFLKGTWTIAVNDKKWERNFINVYCPTISPDGRHIAAEVRLDICEYTIAEDGEPWNQRFGCVWEPSFRDNESLFAPAKVGGNWTLAENGQPIWKVSYHQLWHQKFSPDGHRVAAVVAPSFGQWTIAVNDEPWQKTYREAVLEPFFSADGNHVAAIVKDRNQWTIAVNGKPWAETFDMVWNPVFRPGERDIIAKVEKNKRFTIAVNGKPWKRNFEALWEPVFSPDGSKVLVKAVEDGKYYRRIVPVREILG